MFTFPVWIYPSFFLIAFIYATIGFGGASSYLALFSLTSAPLREVALLALLCNLLVSGGNIFHFSRADKLPLKVLWPFLLGSIPAAYLGGQWKTEEHFQRIALGFCLLLVALRIYLGKQHEKREQVKAEGLPFISLALVMGILLGFLSGYLGIGGGIFLSPFLILTRWASVKEASGAASIFILLNSVSALIARWPFHNFNFIEFLPFGVLVLMGGQMGARLGAYRLQEGHMRKILAAFISWAGLRLLWVAL